MTDTTDDAAESPVKPQVIDLAAEDVSEVKESAGEKPGEDSNTAPPPPKPAKKRGNSGWVIAALLLGALGGGWLYRDLLSFYLPSSAMTRMENRLGALEANNKALQDQLAGLSGTVDQAANTTARIDQAIKDASTGIYGAQGKIDGLDRRVAAAESAATQLKSEVAELRNAVSLGTTAGGGADTAALAALGQRIDALETDVASLKAGSGTGGGQAAALSQSLADLKAKIAAGESYQAEYERIARMVPAAPGLDTLAAHAGLGLPNAQGLAVELRNLIPSLPASETPQEPAGGGYWDSFWSGLTSIITIRDIGENDWRNLAEASAALAEAGDLTGAVSRIDEAEGTKPSGLSQWRDRAQGRTELEQAMQDVAEAVLRQITAEDGAK